MTPLTAYSIFYVCFDFDVSVALTVFFPQSVLYAYYAHIWYCQLEVCRQPTQSGNAASSLIP